MTKKISLPPALEAVIKGMNKKYRSGKDDDKTIGFLSDTKISNVDCIPTGSVGLDMALGIGGWPVGRIVEVMGPESSGKTTLCLHALAEAQKKFPDKYVVFIDMEHTFDVAYAKNLGVDIDRLIITQPSTGSEAIDIVDHLVKSATCSLIVFDSVAAATTQEEKEGDINKNHIGQQARMMSQALKILTATVNESKTTIIFTNQIRMKIGVMFGNPETTAGGNALKFYASVRVDIRRRSIEKINKEAVASLTRFKVIKNKVAPPYKEAEVLIEFGKGFNKVEDIINVAAGLDIIKRAGPTYKYKGENLGLGKEAVKLFFEESPEVFEEIRKEVLSTIKLDMLADANHDSPVSEKDEKDE